MRRRLVPWAAACSWLVLAVRPASADQCQWVTPSQASSAAQWLARSTSWVRYCEPCGDTTPVVINETPSPSVSATGTADFDEVKIDGKSIDLAYTFVPTFGQTYTNLASLAGCEAHGVSHTVMMSTAPPPASASTRCQIASRDEALLATALVASMPWLFLILSLVGGAGFVLGAAFVTRRRRRMTARALGLRDRTPPALDER